ncbi:(2Fe-2S)-binding protein [Thiomicrorhabdus arctica]|jgi:NAD(P)H-nitrite reductase large subunit|uniref:(2Fe-2S)-binding protein n=1 Tax=Thiomicrorhabdus arctica TaxID=131540 RepID=UPI00037F4F43|nr:(2Fe-2S)-binding protein [Thiomicrorhabdus arctica]
MIEDALNKLPEILTRDLERNLCVCNDVLRIDVIQAIDEGADTLEKVRQKTYATDGNGCCKRQVQRLLECLSEDTESTPIASENITHDPFPK